MNCTFVEQSPSCFTLSGAIQHADAPDLERVGLRYFRDIDRIELTLIQIDTFDSALIAVLLAWHRYAIKQNKQLYLRVQSSAVMLLMQMYGVCNIFTYLD